MRRFCAGRLASRRRRMGKTQVRLALEAGVSQVSISAIESGKKQPRLSTLARIADSLNCTMDYFFEYAEGSGDQKGGHGQNIVNKEAQSCQPEEAI